VAAGLGRVRAMFDDKGQSVRERALGPGGGAVSTTCRSRRRAAGGAGRQDGAHLAEARARRRRAASLAHPTILSGGARLEDVFAMVQAREVGR